MCFTDLICKAQGMQHAVDHAQCALFAYATMHQQPVCTTQPLVVISLPKMPDCGLILTSALSTRLTVTQQCHNGHTATSASVSHSDHDCPNF